MPEVLCLSIVIVATIAILIQRFSRPPLNYQPPSFSSQLRAHFVAQSNGSNTGWLMDSGASHHVTSDLQNMSLHSEHDDSDDIVIGNGTSLHITHTGFTKLFSFYSNFSQPFTLSKVLCVPSMKKNLVSVSKFCLEPYLS